MRVSESFTTPLWRSARNVTSENRDRLQKRLRYAALACAFSAVAALLVAWAFIVPIFQSPDEPVHTDYAFSILTAGHLIHARDGAGTRVANDFTTYLIDSTDFYRIAFHGSMRVPPNYGSREYFSALDKKAPSFTAVKAAQNSSGKVNWLTAVYPFAYYALEAAVMGVVYHASASITSAFFAGRLFSVLLTLCGLCIGYRVARMAGLRPAVAVLFTAAIGFFPLTTFIGSYIQPDTLGFFAVLLSIYAAMRALRRPAPLEYSLLGISLALLLLTKMQYLIPVAGAAFFALIALWASHRIRLRAIAAAIGCIGIPMIAAAAASHNVSSQTTAQRLSGLHSEFSFAPLHQAAAGGFLHFASFLTSAVWRGFDDYFISGQSWQSYWGAFGWLDVQMLFVNHRWTNIVHVGIVFVTLLTMLCSAFVFVRNLSRLKRIAGRRGFWSAARIASLGIPFNSFALFLAIMMALYAATGNVFGAQGRNWYPFIIPSFLCFVLVAPEVTRRLRVRNYLRVGAAALFLCYSFAAAPIALATIQNRYYGLESLAANALSVKKALAAPVARNAGVVDGASCGDFNAVSRDCVQPPNLDVNISGWAIDAAQRDIGSAVFVLVDGHAVIPAQYDLHRPDVAKAFNTSAYSDSGFLVTVPGRLLRSAGIHQAQVVEVLADESSYAKIGSPLRIRVSPIKISGPIEPPGMAAKGFIDGTSPVPDPENNAVTLSAGNMLRLSGWVLGPHNQQYGAVVVTSDGRYVSGATYPLPRPDVSDALHEPLTQVGFSAKVAAAKIGEGKHTVRVLAVALDGKSYYQIGAAIPVTVLK